MAHLRGAYEVDGDNIDTVKESIVKFGACYYDYYAKAGCSTLYEDEYGVLNETFFYNGEKHVATHAVSIVGWDDNFDRTKFVKYNGEYPKENGAWLVKDSAGWSDTTVWISYESIGSKFTFFDFESADDYQYNYQYDGLAGNYKLTDTSAEFGQMGNIFTAQHNDTVKAVGFYTGAENTSYKVYVYKNCRENPTDGELASIKEGVLQYTGYHVVRLSDFVNVKKGEKYSVVVEIRDQKNGNPLIKTTGANNFGYQPGKKGTSFYRFGSGEWKDVGVENYDSNYDSYDYCMRVKAFADIATYSVKVAGNSSANAEVSYNDKKYNYGDTMTFTVTPKNGYNIHQLGVLVNGEMLQGNNGTYTLTMSDDVNIKVIDPNTTFKINYINDGSSYGTGEYNYTIGKSEFVKPKKTGYVFTGWTKDSKADENSELVTGISTSEYGDITLYAVWKPVKYTLVLKKDNGVTENKSYEFEFNQVYEIPENTFTRNGYNFIGWNTKYDGSGTSYADKATVSNLANTQTKVFLYAQWESHCYTVTFNANGGNGEMKNSSIPYDLRSYLPENKFTRKGYKFAGWSETADGEVKYTDHEYVLNISGDETTKSLYAVWTPNTYTVSFDANGGETYMKEQVIEYGNPTNLQYRRVYKNGYDFKEWNTKADGSGTSYSDEESVVNLTEEENGKVTLYAQWEPTDCWIDLYSDDETYCKRIKHIYGNVTQLPAIKKAGYDFAGWLDSETGEIVYVVAPDRYWNSDFIAQWTPASYEIVYETDGGTVNTGKVEYYYHEAGITLPTDVTKEGYDFGGWYDNAKFTGEALTEISADASGTQTMYAKWIPKKYKVTLVDKGNFSLELMDVKEYTYGKTQELFSCSRESYHFKGWYDNAEFTGDEIKEIPAGTIGDKVYYAKWIYMFENQNPETTPEPTEEVSPSPESTAVAEPTETPTITPVVLTSPAPVETSTAAPEPTEISTPEPANTPVIVPIVPEPINTSVVISTDAPETSVPKVTPTVTPTVKPTVKPTVSPTVRPTVKPTSAPTTEPSMKPTVEPTVKPVKKAVPKKNKKLVYKGIKYTVTKSSAKNGTIKVTGVKNTVKNVVITDTIKINGYVFKITEIDSKAFMNNKKIVFVKIGKNVKTIGKDAFRNCIKLRKVSGGKSVKKIGKNVFKGCKKVKLPNNFRKK